MSREHGQVVVPRWRGFGGVSLALVGHLSRIKSASFWVVFSRESCWILSGLMLSVRIHCFGQGLIPRLAGELSLGSIGLLHTGGSILAVMALRGSGTGISLVEVHVGITEAGHGEVSLRWSRFHRSSSFCLGWGREIFLLVPHEFKALSRCHGGWHICSEGAEVGWFKGRVRRGNTGCHCPSNDWFLDTL